MLAPKRQKYRRAFRGKRKGMALRGNELNFGEYGLKALENGHISAAQLEAARKAISHCTKREGKIWLRVFPHLPITARAAGAGMGAGKGEVKGFVVVIRPGRIMFELSGVSEETAEHAFRLASAKLPVATRFLKKEQGK